MSGSVVSDPPKLSRRRARRAREQQSRVAQGVTTDLGVPDQPTAAEPTDLIGRWNILDRGVRPLVVRSDGTFTLFDPVEGRADGRWVRVSDTFVSLFVGGPKRHSMYSMPDGQVFLSRYTPPGSASTPELLFRSVLSFEGTWETPYRASQYTPAPPTQMSLGADRTFCADLGHSDDDGSVVVWSGIWARTGYTSATLDYVTWVVTDGARRMAGHGQTTLELRDDGALVVGALDDVFYPAPGTVRAEGEEPLATAEEPAVLLCPLAVEDETPEPAEPVLDVATTDGSADQDATDDGGPERQAVADPMPGTEVAPARVAGRSRTVPPEEMTAARRRAAHQDAVATTELPILGPAELGSVGPVGVSDLAVGSGAAVPVARTTADDGTAVVVVLYADTDGVLQVGALPAPGDQPEVRTAGQADHVTAGPAELTSTVTPDLRGVPQTLPVAATWLDDGTPVTVVLYVDENEDLQVGGVPASGLGAG